jgi:hypothetical protein
MLTKRTLCYRNFLEIKIYLKKLKLGLKNTIIDKTLTYASQTWILIKRDRKQTFFKGKCMEEIYAVVKNPTITETIRFDRLCWFGHVQRIEENRIPRKVLYMNLERTRLRGRPRSRWQNELRDDGRLVGGIGWKKRVYNGEEWKLLRTTRNCHILHVPME